MSQEDSATCLAGIARCSLLLGDLKQGRALAMESNSPQLCKECGQILESEGHLQATLLCDCASNTFMLTESQEVKPIVSLQYSVKFDPCFIVWPRPHMMSIWDAWVVVCKCSTTSAISQQPCTCLQSVFGHKQIMLQDAMHDDHIDSHVTLVVDRWSHVGCQTYRIQSCAPAWPFSSNATLHVSEVL